MTNAETPGPADADRSRPLDQSRLAATPEAPAPAPAPAPAVGPPPRRWECGCTGERPVLLATYDDAGEIRVKVRDRYLYASGWARAICPRCGEEHVLDLRARPGYRPPLAVAAGRGR